jgi:lipopolysaccharide transport system ATP-binding protein
MKKIAVQVEHLSKKYQLGTIGYGSLYRDFESWRARIMGREDPNSPVFGPGRNDGKGDFWALKNIGLTIEEGDRLGIIGKNGAGKSTLLKILSQITRPTTGTARIRGRVSSLLEVGTGFHPELTGRENVYLNGAIMGMKRAEIQRKFDEIVGFAGVEQFIDTPVKRYSSGMYVRLGFAVAAHLDPDILIVDEVLAVGDAAFQKKCLGKMEDVAREGRTVLFVSHNMFSVKSLCQRGVLLEDGQVRFDGEISKTVDTYLGTGASYSGECKWDSPDQAPGDGRVRLKSVRTVTEGKVSGEVDIDKAFRIEVEYWNLEPNGKRLVSIHVLNSMGITVLTSANMPSVSSTPDPWSGQAFPRGLFKTSCTIPGLFLNDGPYSISVYINDGNVFDVILVEKEVLTFSVRETGVMRKEFLAGPWLGVVRPLLSWETQKLE